MEDGKVERAGPPGDMLGGAKRQELRLGAHSSSTSSSPPRSSPSPSFYRSFISLLFFPYSFTDSSSSTSFMMSKVKDHS